ncbi:MAG: hypothetical protein ACP5NA_05610 [Candidatus Acidulodesulfobacterium sp.]
MNANDDKSIIYKILKIAGVDACAISSLDGEVLQFEANDTEIQSEQINRVSREISKLFASYSISSIEINSLYLNFDDRNIIVNGFGSGFIFILSKRNSNVNLLKMETAYLESEFVKIVNQSITADSPKKTEAIISNENGTGSFAQSETAFDSILNSNVMSGSGISSGEVVPKNKMEALKDLFSENLGPISSIIFEEKLNDLNENINNFHLDNIENLINNLAQEIENKKERLNFITAANKIINS